ncbi:MAG: hypothetical protein K0B15_00755 [Lentimicrobium sp.]|nr:hypothetical protein [Lentimicrobium sp.]
MVKKLFNTRNIIIFVAIIGAAFMRLLPHWPNFTPVAAMALFGGAWINRKALAFLVPLSAMLISDLFIGFHSTMIAVYAGIIVTVMIGFALRNRVKAGNVVMASVVSTLVFYLITNFGAWMSGMMPYPKDFSGLMQAYIAGIPFFNNGLMGDMFYSTVFFGGFYLISKRYPSVVKA